MGARPRRGFALLAAVIIVAVVAVVATVVTVTISGDNDQDRIERAADVLHRLVAAIDTVRSSSGASFGGSLGATKYPFKLSELTHRISTSDLSCAGASGTPYAGGDVTNWRGPYYLAPIPTTGYRVAPGFFANNQLVKVSTTDLAIQMDNVSLADAKALDLLVDRRADGGGGAAASATIRVTFALTDPTSVRYHIFSSVAIC